MTRISEALGLPVIGIYTIGHARKTSRGDPLEGTYQDCALRVRLRADLRHDVLTIPGAIEMVRQAFLAAPPDVRLMLCDPELKKGLYCFSRLERLTIRPDDLNTLADLGIELGFYDAALPD